MTQAFDNRLVRVGIIINGKTTTYDERFDIRIQGQKFDLPGAGNCEVTISNIDKERRNFLLTNASPFATGQRKAQVSITVDVGRQSFGTFRLFQGSVFAGSPTQPPNIGITLRSLGMQYMLGQPVSNSLPARSTLKQLAQQIASDCNVTLDFQATDKIINNYHFTGAAYKQVQKLREAGGCRAFIDNGTLHVYSLGQGRANPILISAKTGMIGVPNVTEKGVSVLQRIDREIKMVDMITVQSEINPAANGTYPLFRLAYTIATRAPGLPFFWQCDASRYGYPAAV